MVKRLAVVGGGTGGTFTANMLSAKLRERVRAGEVEILLVGEGFRHHFQPANMDIAFRGAHPDDQSRSEMDLLKPEVKFIPDPARRIDLDERTIDTEGGDHFKYDRVVIATGSEANPRLVSGLAEGSVNFHTSPINAMKVWESLRNLRKGRIGVLIAGVPHKCPPAPDEAVLLIEEQARRWGIRGDVEITLLTPYARAYPAAKISRIIAPIFDERGIKMMPFFNVDYVDPAAKRAYSLEGDEYAYDLLIAIPPHRGARVVRDSGLGDGEGWIKTDRRTMKIQGHDDAFAIGDATNIPISKSGMVAHQESKVVAANLAAEVDGEDRVLDYNGRLSCPVAVGNRRAFIISGTYDKPVSGQAPSLLKYEMMRGFGAIYWSALTGGWEWMLDAYLGPTSEEEPRKSPGAAQS